MSLLDTIVEWYDDEFGDHEDQINSPVGGFSLLDILVEGFDFEIVSAAEGTSSALPTGRGQVDGAETAGHSHHSAPSGEEAARPQRSAAGRNKGSDLKRVFANRAADNQVREAKAEMSLSEKRRAAATSRWNRVAKADAREKPEPGWQLVAREDVSKSHAMLPFANTTSLHASIIGKVMSLQP